MFSDRLFSTVIVLAALFSLLPFCSPSAAENSQEISGTIREGYRVLTVTGKAAHLDFTVYRGDYIKFAVQEKAEPQVLVIPALKVDQQLTADLNKAPYVKMKKTGVFPYSLGTVTGVIQVVEYDRPQYRVLTSEEAARFIEERSPLVLDVRTVREYAGGHLENSINIPVQELQRRYDELSPYRGEDILIYCATGNRSTVAAKILIDNGFTRISNLREGFYLWLKKGFPAVR